MSVLLIPTGNMTFDIHTLNVGKVKVGFFKITQHMEKLIICNTKTYISSDFTWLLHQHEVVRNWGRGGGGCTGFKIILKYTYRG